MTSLVWACAALMVGQTPADKAKSDLDALQGEWKCVFSEMDGREGFVPTNDVRIRFEKGTMTTVPAGEECSKLSFTIDPTKNPKRMVSTIIHNKLIPESKGMKIYQIYEIDGDKLKICYPPTTTPTQFPKSFKTEKGKGGTLGIYERVKERRPGKGQMVGQTPADKAKSDLDALQGEWKCVFSEMDGREGFVPRNDARLRFEKDTMTTVPAGEECSKLSFTIDPTRNPKRMVSTIIHNRLIPESKGMKIYQIYEIDGDKLKICYPPTITPTQFPKSFKTEKGKGGVLDIYERVKERRPGKGQMVGQTPADKAKSDLEAMQGEWKCVYAETNGEKGFVPVNDVRIRIDNHSLTCFLAELAWKVSFTIDPTKNPKRMMGTITYDKLIPENKGVKVYWIYEIDGDRLKIRFADEHTPTQFPKYFKTEERTGGNLDIYERVKKEKERWPAKPKNKGGKEEGEEEGSEKVTAAKSGQFRANSGDGANSGANSGDALRNS